MMSEKRFTIVGEEYVGYTQGNAYIISNGECKFSLWESKEDAQKVCDYLNELSEENEQLRKDNKEMRHELDSLSGCYCADNKEFKDYWRIGYERL